MLTPIALIIAILLQVLAAIIALSLIKLTKGRLSWILISIGFLIMAIRRIIEFLPYVSESDWQGIINLDHWLGVITSVFIITGVILIGEIFYSLKKAKKVIMESERKFRALFNNSSDQIYVQDFDGKFLEVNRVLCESLGYGKEELLKKHSEDIESPKFMHMAPSILEDIKNKGELIFESEYQNKKGKIYPVEIKSRVIDYSNRKAILSIARDISERKLLERKVLNAIIETEEKDKERFAKDLHDGLGTLLSSINIYIDMLKSKTVELPEKDKILDFIGGLMNEAIHNTKEIAYNLMPDSISRFGLVNATKAHCDRINKTGFVTINFDSKLEMISLTSDLEVTLFRVIKELINNSLKHAEADKINIHLYKEEYLLVLDFHDNGKGFDVESILLSGNHKGMGLSNLISRVKAFNGTCKINSQKGHGTRVIIKIKRD